MSKNYWQQKLQSSLQQSLQTVNSTVSSISSDGAARCAFMQWMQASKGPLMLKSITLHGGSPRIGSSHQV